MTTPLVLRIMIIIWMHSIAIEAACPRDPDSKLQCSGHGSCNSLNQCVCAQRHSGVSCSKVKCPMGVAWSADAIAKDAVHYKVECSNRGRCNSQTGRCDCDLGFIGSACHRLSCPNKCNSKGECISLKQLSEFNKHGVDFVYDSIWDHSKIYGCKCDLGFFGVDCSRKRCPTGDDPLTTGQVNEIQLISCTSTGGSFELYFDGFSTSIAYNLSPSQLHKQLMNLPTLSNVKITYLNGTSICKSDASNVVSIEFLQNFGPQPLLKAYSKWNGVVTLSTGRVSTIHGGKSLSGVFSVVGTKEDTPCSNRGVCSEATGQCNCYTVPMPGYRSSDGYGNTGNRGDCGCADDKNKYGGKIKGCPGEISCSGHGACLGSPTFKCICGEGWTSGDCSLRSCPKGLSWFHYPTADNDGHNTFSECSDGGNCDKTTGQCNCADPFSGPACEYMKCPGELKPCSGHGICMGLSQLASESLVNGELGGFTYGSDPNNAHTWDADKIQGCKCDSGFEGHDCSLVSCPRGDDPLTKNQNDEVQVFQCTASGGYFRVEFRNKISSIISYNADAKTLKTRLDELPTINDVIVSYSRGSSACSTSASPNYIKLTFPLNYGKLPSIKILTDNLIDSNNGGSIGSGKALTAVNGTTLGQIKSISGTKEWAECSNKGICNYATGQCKCSLGYGSSDGFGNIGVLGDCGYILPFFEKLQ